MKLVEEISFRYFQEVSLSIFITDMLGLHRIIFEVIGLLRPTLQSELCDYHKCLYASTNSITESNLKLSQINYLIN